MSMTPRYVLIRTQIEGSCRFQKFDPKSEKINRLWVIWLIILYDSYINFNQPIRFRDKNLSSTNLFLSGRVTNIFAFPNWFTSMVGFNLDTGGRRCIRAILEKYETGKGSINIIFTTCKM